VKKINGKLLYTFLYVVLVFPLCTGLKEPTWDALQYDLPTFAYIMDSYKEFRFPLWDPYSNGGIPFHAAALTAILNPLAICLVYFFSHAYSAFMAYWLILWWWGGFGIIHVSRLYGCSEKGSAAAALIYVFSGFYIAHAEHSYLISAASWLPWVFLCGELSIQRRNVGYAVLGSLSLGLSSLGGYPVLVFFTGFSLSLWLAFRHFSKKNLTRIVLHLLIIAIGSIVIYSPMLVSFFIASPEFTPRSQPFSPAVANSGSVLTPQALFSMISPYSNIVAQKILGTDISMANVYTGIFSIPLAAIALVHFRKRINIFKYIILFLFFFLIPLGEYGVVKTVLYHALLPFKYMQYNSAYRYLWIFYLAIVAGVGFTVLERVDDSFQDNIKWVRIWMLAVITGSIALCIFLFCNHLLKFSIILPLYFPSLIILPSFLILLFFLNHKSKNVVKYAPLILLLFIFIDCEAHFWFNNKTIYRKRIQTVEKNLGHRSSNYFYDGPGKRLLEYSEKYFNKQYFSKDFLIFSYVDLFAPEFRYLTYQSNFRSVMQAPNFYWLSPGVEKCESPSQITAALKQTSIEDPIPVFLDGDISLPPKRVKFGTFGLVNILIYSPEYIKMDIIVPDQQGGFLASTERFADAWEVYIDGKKGVVAKNNLFFRGSYVPYGTHVVEWRYWPKYWLPLVAASYAYIILSLGTGMILIRREKQRRHLIK
jgi:hypothetical protein